MLIKHNLIDIKQYLMYLHYCKGMFRVGVVDVNKTQSNRYKTIFNVSALL